MSKRQSIQQQDWLKHLAALRGAEQANLLQEVISLYPESSNHLIEQGLGVADLLLSLGLDIETLSAAIVYPGYRDAYFSQDMLIEHLGVGTAKLVHDVIQMQALGRLRDIKKREAEHLEQLRKMFLAMVTDVRAILIILAERIWLLHQAKHASIESQQALADETLQVYAPLANRLGVWQLKWELEDFCLRYLHPDIYKTIAKSIASRRQERETYVESFITELTNVLHEAHIQNFQVMGRAKHIYSIYNKMQRKNTRLESIYDMSALRVLTDTIDQCYAVLSVLQQHWQQIPEEFDDYIAHPKSNGYQSIHTVLIGPNKHHVEVQIRTLKMHQESELGVAAHWRYKEGVLQTSSYESKIALLRQVMAWQKELSGQDTANQDKSPVDLFADRVYVFTPVGDIIDLPLGSTPIDFAYAIHSEVGHRCRGAKVDGQMVTLTHPLQTGQRVEILTAKLASPSRDWLNPHLGYIKSPRTRAKLQHWFKLKDAALGSTSPKELLEKEDKKHVKEEKAIPIVDIKDQPSPANIHVLGIDKLLTHTAKCCKPLPGDRVLGYITRHHGVSIHRHDCTNLHEMLKAGVERLIEVTWRDAMNNAYPADLLIKAVDRAGLLRDITSILVAEKFEIAGLQTQKIDTSQVVDIYLTIKVISREQLDQAVKFLLSISNIISVLRR